MSPRARNAVAVSVVIVIGMILYVLIFKSAYRLLLHRKAVVSQAYYAAHCRDSMLTDVEFRPMSEPIVMFDTISLKHPAPARICYFDGGDPQLRRLLARISLAPYDETRCTSRCEIFLGPRQKETGRPAFTKTDSVWRKAWYVGMERDSVWQKIPLISFPERRDYAKAEAGHTLF